MAEASAALINHADLLTNVVRVVGTSLHREQLISPPRDGDAGELAAAMFAAFTIDMVRAADADNMLAPSFRRDPPMEMARVCVQVKNLKQSISDKDAEDILAAIPGSISPKTR